MVYHFPKGISSKVNVTQHLGFDLANFEFAVEHFSCYFTDMNEAVCVSACTNALWKGIIYSPPPVISKYEDRLGSLDLAR